VLGWIFREIGSTFVSIPLFVILACSVAAFYRTPWVLSSGLPFPIAVLIYSWAWMFVAYDVRDEAIRIKGERKGKRPSANELLPRILKRTLFVTKYVTMTGMLVIVSLSFFGVMPPESHSSWGQMLEASYEWNAPLAGHWWLIIPALVAIALFVMCTFVIIDRLEASVDLETSEQRSTAAESRITAA
jgi:ABC-type dipeptide/oligopeptide/nickel transport system permease subunit